MPIGSGWSGELTTADNIRKGDVFAWTGQEFLALGDADDQQEPGWWYVWTRDVSGATLTCRIGPHEQVEIRPRP